MPVLPILFRPIDNGLFSFQGVLWLNIGSVDSFERNLENVQSEMNIDPPNWIPVVYKNEIEPSSLAGFIPSLLLFGWLNDRSTVVNCEMSDLSSMNAIFQVFCYT